MNTIDKIKKSWWVLLSFIPFLNGFGFGYIGLRHNNKNWILEGAMYEVPWIFYFIIYSIIGPPIGLASNPTSKILLLAFILYLVSIFRSLLVAVRLFDIYVDEEKPRVQATVVKQQSNDKISDTGGCCLCIFVIFIIFAVIAIL